MANIKSQIKRNRQNEKRQLRNRAIRSSLKTHVKNVEVAFTESNENSVDALKKAISAIDRACTKGVLHKNTAARKKSRLVKRLNAISNS